MRAVTIFVFAGLLILAGGVQASLVEDNTPVRYQNDDHSGQDAADTCEASGSPEEAEVRLTVDSEDPSEGEGQLVPVDDAEDHWLLPVETVPADGTITVSAETSAAGDFAPLFPSNVQLIVLGPDCEELARKATPAGTGTSVEVVVEEPGPYRASLVHDRSGGHLVDGTGVDLTPEKGEHCAPGCFFAYQMYAAS